MSGMKSPITLVAGYKKRKSLTAAFMPKKTLKNTKGKQS